MQDRPTAIELLDALTDFMRDRAGHARDRWERFQFQVAANSMGIIRRELEMEDAFIRDEWRGLDALLGPERIPEEPAALAARLRARNEELSGRIRRGEFDGGPGEARLVAHLWEAIVNKVRIASPREAP
jgi:hypothetical protein